MSRQRSFVRKIVYVVAMVLLLLPLYLLSQPASPESRSGGGSPGGLLVQLREKYGLSQAQLGQIDPASETVKLAILGMRGVAATILWEKANAYKMKKDWANLGATLNQIIKVQPNFVSVWIFQGHNLSYNVSVDFDDYRERYRWVIKGIEFLQEGIRYNEREPQLYREIGRYVSQKIGRADESKQFRRLFKQDDDFHGSRPMALRDNWLVGKQWYLKTEKLVDSGVPFKVTPQVFRAEAPLCQMYYGETLEKEGTFGEVAKLAWKTASDEWHQLGSFDVPTGEGIIHLNDAEMFDEESRKLAQKLDELAPGVRQEMLKEKLAGLNKEQRQAIDTPVDQRTWAQQRLAVAVAETALAISHDEVARRVTGANRKEAVKLANEATKKAEKANWIRRRRDDVNFDYWRIRAEMEQTEDAVAAHRLIYEGDQAFHLADLVPAREKYEQGLFAWRKVLNAYPSMIVNDIMGDELMDVIERYRRILEQLDLPMPKDFILQDIVRLHENRG
jgi:hypothetical protein